MIQVYPFGIDYQRSIPMIIATSQINPKSYQKPLGLASESTTLGFEFDPLAGLRKFASDSIEIGGSLVGGALPGYGAYDLAKRGLSAGFSGNGTNMNLGWGGAALNTVGSLGLVVGAGQQLLGADPTIALGLSVASLAGAGLASAIMTARQ
jgi:hypothetical protein